MVTIRDIRRKSRRDVHAKARVPALYLVQGNDPVPCQVRLHTRFDSVGELPSGSASGAYAEADEQQPRIIFERAEVSAPRRLAVVSVEAGEAYRIDHTRTDDQFVTAFVIPLSSVEAEGLPVPDTDG